MRNIRFPIIMTVCALWLLTAACTSGNHSGISKKRMPDFYYVFRETELENPDFDSSIARAMELFASDPDVFGDPVGIIFGLPDSSGTKPLERRIGLVLTDPDWIPPPGALKEEIPGGKALSATVQDGFDDADSLWNEIRRFAGAGNYELISPGIEIYRGYDTESASAAIELIIRIK